MWFVSFVMKTNLIQLPHQFMFIIFASGGLCRLFQCLGV